jgi:hypothetical protein
MLKVREAARVIPEIRDEMAMTVCGRRVRAAGWLWVQSAAN